ncbi:MAG: Iron-sulfur cluster assembly protein [Candidatus Peregrinibacteria bacterium GW2011_GWA2_44_7]|nr:MAG: Iron-sulfur cluster assembly protein [Candidatus Peregrinibacteria bacterium GW2011_GWA2_44_7]
MPDANLMHSGVNVTCGDHIRLYLKTEPQGDDAVILDASWQGEGCAISVAAASFLTEEIKGMTLESARLLTKEDLFCWMGVELGPARVKCGTLSLETLQGALLQKE